jgi:DNA-binding GntR family transcriptional regulator
MKTAANPLTKQKAEHGTSLRIAFEQIRDLIVHGKLSPGTWLIEGDLAEKLGMSRTPVRSAIQWLQREGYVIEYKNVSKSRMVVAPLTKEDASELYSIIGRVEGLAGRRIALLRKTERLEVVRKLKEINEQLRLIPNSKPPRPTAIFDLDRSFHRTIVESGAGPRLLVLHRAIEPQAERYWRLYASAILSNLHLSLAEHDKIVSAIVAGDEVRIDQELQANWKNGCERLAQLIDAFGERGSG